MPTAVLSVVCWLDDDMFARPIANVPLEVRSLIGSLRCLAGVRVSIRGPGPGGPAGNSKDLTWLVPRMDVA